jgi:hypothetical protein
MNRILVVAALFVDAWNHAFGHLQKFKEGDRSEDHLAHLACNVAFMVWAVKHGRYLAGRFWLPHVRRSAISTEMMPSPSTSARSLPHCLTVVVRFLALNMK